jgi:hypothetical protein
MSSPGRLCRAVGSRARLSSRRGRDQHELDADTCVFAILLGWMSRVGRLAEM